MTTTTVTITLGATAEHYTDMSYWMAARRIKSYVDITPPMDATVFAFLARMTCHDTALYIRELVLAWWPVDEPAPPLRQSLLNEYEMVCIIVTRAPRARCGMRL